MNLTASMVIRNELDRYLKPCVDHLLDFCDQIVILDDASDDGSREWLIEHPDDRVHVVVQNEPTFYVHEGRTRQRLLEATLATAPTHVLSIDADEFVSDGLRLRRLLGLETQALVWSLRIEEIWKADGDSLFIREDGGWRSHQLPVLWRAPAQPSPHWKMLDRKLACRRMPIPVLEQAGRASVTGVSLLHLGWLNQATRRARYDRYAQHDGGRFHAGSHLRSILLPDAKVKLSRRDWPAGEVFDRFRAGFAPVAA